MLYWNTCVKVIVFIITQISARARDIILTLRLLFTIAWRMFTFLYMWLYYFEKVLLVDINISRLFSTSNDFRSFHSTLHMIFSFLSINFIIYFYLLSNNNLLHSSRYFGTFEATISGWRWIKQVNRTIRKINSSSPFWICFVVKSTKLPMKLCFCIAQLSKRLKQAVVELFSSKRI